MGKRVVITGIGAVSAAGPNLVEIYESILAKKTFI